MSTVLEVAGLLLGFVLLIKGADVFVDASVNIAKMLRIPNIVIGLTIVAVGTSAPEMVISVSAALSGSNAMAVGNVIGSNLFNLLFIVGLCALVKPIAVRIQEIAKDYWVSVAAAVLLLIMKVMFNDVIPRAGSAVLLAAFIAYMVVLVRQAMKNRDTEPEEQDTVKRSSLPRNILFAIAGVALIVAGGQFAVNNAVSIALTLGITERIVGLTILAAGTSLPELITSIVASKKGENDIAIGNVIGSNIFNLMFVLGLSGLVMPLTIDNNLLVDISVLIGASLVFFLFAFTNRKIVRFEGFSLVMFYAVYMAFILW